ncbi:PQQ-binding-like beta-propeller repeat protein [Halorussus lipolyticus]|uniref:outer membrane protein assembly factor BamB family protein n=1 Tax=Halorussus lipolyticus TaxID=3034024 RepID=UPI0023E829C0|nr:PQQ-binding-like beta-propeller repeat protein [Halorussus sp. DT80]
MAEWSSTRREFLASSGVGSLTRANTTDTGEDLPSAPTAQVKWSLDTGEEATFLRRSGADEMLYVGTPTGVHGLSTDGTERWRRAIASRDSDFPVEVYPERGVVYAEAQSGVYALDSSDGSTRWRYTGEQRADITLLTGDSVLLQQQGLVAVSASNGDEQWRFEPDDPVWIRPHAVDGSIYAGTIHGHLYALSTATGHVDWHVDYSGSEDPPRFWIAGSTETTLLAWDSKGAELYSFDLSDGSLGWRFPANESSVAFSGAVRNDIVYLADGPLLRAISTANGTERWQYNVGHRIAHSPKFAGGTGYLGTAGGVHAISMADASPLWQFSTGVDTSVYVANADDGTVLVDSIGDAVYALDAESGSPKWQFKYDARSRWFPQTDDDAVYLATGSGTVYALSAPDLLFLYDAYQTLKSPAGIAFGSLFGSALAAEAYRRYVSDDSDQTKPTTFAGLKVRDTIGKTEYSSVFEAQTASGEEVALKRVCEDNISSEEFSKAVETWATLDISGAAAVRAWATEPTPWVAMNLADGSLADRADTLSFEELVHSIADATETVHRAHREGIVHGRVTPENILFVDGEVRVSDWRLAAELHGSPEVSDTRQIARMVDGLLADEQQTEKLADVLSHALEPNSGDGYDSLLKFADALRWTVRK